MYNVSERGDQMGYSVKWVLENLGITRDMLRYYEKEKLISVDETRNPSNKYRDYSDEDIERIWGIKLLISIGFTAKEIRAIVDEEFDFYGAISQKVEDLEKRYNEITTSLEFAKTIKITGCVPTVNQIGSIKFNDFIGYCKDNWNIYSDPQMIPIVESIDDFSSVREDNLNADNVKKLLKAFEGMDPTEFAHYQTIDGYFRVVSDMKKLGFDDPMVQKIVSLVHEYMSNNMISLEYREKFTPLCFAERTIPMFLESEIAKINENKFGKDCCLFIAKAIACYGKY